MTPKWGRSDAEPTNINKRPNFTLIQNKWLQCWIIINPHPWIYCRAKTLNEGHQLWLTVGFLSVEENLDFDFNFNFSSCVFTTSVCHRYNLLISQWRKQQLLWSRFLWVPVRLDACLYVSVSLTSLLIHRFTVCVYFHNWSNDFSSNREEVQRPPVVPHLLLIVLMVMIGSKSSCAALLCLAQMELILH